MTNLDFQNYLKNFADEMPIKILVDHETSTQVQDMDLENILLTAPTAYVDENASEDEWDTEDGKVELGDVNAICLSIR